MPVRLLRWPASANLSRVFFERAPGLFAGLLPPNLVEPAFAQRLAEASEFGLVEDEAALGKPRTQGVHPRDHIRTLLEGPVIEVLHHDRTKIRRQSIHALLVRHDPEPVPEMVGERAILLNLVEFEKLDVSKWIFLRIGETRPQRRIDFLDVDRRRRGTEMLENRLVDRNVRQADLQSLQIGSGLDRLHVRRDLTETVVKGFFGDDDAGLLKICPHQFAIVTVPGRPDLIIAAEGVAEPA